MVGAHEEHYCDWRRQAEMLRERLAEQEARAAEQEARAAEQEARAAEQEARAAEQEARAADLEHQLEVFKRQLFGQKSEKQRPAYKAPRPPADPVETRRKRHAAAEARAGLDTVDVQHTIEPQDRTCTKCGGEADKPLPKKVSYEVEYVPPRFVRHRHVRDVLACGCGEFIVEAPAPVRVYDKCQYGPNLCAHIIVSKLSDSQPMYRLSKMLGRVGLTISDRTLIDLFHRCAEQIKPLYDALMRRIATADIVQADETTLKVLDKGKARTGWVWTFLTGALIGYRFSASRSGQTPVAVLGASPGTLVVDAYTGYNEVLRPEHRERAGCLAHVRRKFVDARTDDETAAAKALELIAAVYHVEHEAKANGIARSYAHLALRRSRSRPAMEAFKEWLDTEKPRHLPKGPTGKAIAYALNNWDELTVFLDNAAVPADNNASESALRIVALGRKNFLFVGHDVAGQNLAMLLSLVRTCEATGINPLAYLADVFIRLASWPISRIDELLPHRWAQACSSQADAPSA